MKITSPPCSCKYSADKRQNRYCLDCKMQRVAEALLSYGAVERCSGLRIYARLCKLAEECDLAPQTVRTVLFAMKCRGMADYKDNVRFGNGKRRDIARGWFLTMRYLSCEGLDGCAQGWRVQA